MLQSEELKRDININPSSPYAVDVSGSFQFASSEPPDTTIKTVQAGFGGMGDKIKDRDKAQKAKKEKKEAEKEAKRRKTAGLPALETAKEREPFALRDINLKIPRGESVRRDGADDRRSGVYCWEGGYREDIDVERVDQ